jgi:hypothetical protein
LCEILQNLSKGFVSMQENKWLLSNLIIWNNYTIGDFI